MPEIYATFVMGAPHQARRALIYSALSVWTQLVWDLLPGSSLWVDGGFVTLKPESPKDVDVVILTPPGTPIVGVDRLHPLLTMENVSYNLPDGTVGGLQRLQPMGGLVDGFLVPATDGNKVAFWDGWWRRVKGSSDVKGYLEVSGP